MMNTSEELEQQDEIFFMEQVDGTWHKMRLPEGVERKVENCTMLGKFKKIEMSKLSAEEIDNLPEEVEFFFASGQYIPEMIWVEPVKEEQNG
jgi:hypothetical protein